MVENPRITNKISCRSMKLSSVRKKLKLICQASIFTGILGCASNTIDEPAVISEMAMSTPESATESEKDIVMALSLKNSYIKPLLANLARSVEI